MNRKRIIIVALVVAVLGSVLVGAGIALDRRAQDIWSRLFQLDQAHLLPNQSTAIEMRKIPGGTDEFVLTARPFTQAELDWAQMEGYRPILPYRTVRLELWINHELVQVVERTPDMHPDEPLVMKTGMGDFLTRAHYNVQAVIVPYTVKWALMFDQVAVAVYRAPFECCGDPKRIFFDQNLQFSIVNR